MHVKSKKKKKKSIDFSFFEVEEFSFKSMIKNKK